MMARKRPFALGCLFVAAVTSLCLFYYDPDCCGLHHLPDYYHGARRRGVHHVPTVLTFHQRDDGGMPPPDCLTLTLEDDQRPSEDVLDELHHGTWHEVDSSDWHVYSAYVDRRLRKPLVRIVAMVRGTGGEPALYCRWWYDGKKVGRRSSPACTRVQKQELWIRSWDSATKSDRFYHPYLLSCQLPDDPPSAVSVSTGKSCDLRPRHRFQLPVTHHPLHLPSPPADGGFVVCLKPLDFDEGSSPTDIGPRLTEWLELLHILGADSVHAYVRRLGDPAWNILRHYEALGRLTWTNHSLPGEPSVPVHDRTTTPVVGPEQKRHDSKFLGATTTFGTSLGPLGVATLRQNLSFHRFDVSSKMKWNRTLLAGKGIRADPRQNRESSKLPEARQRRPSLHGTTADDVWQKRRHEMAVYNDCLYRHLHSHRFVVNLDLDEAIVPVRHDTWPDLLRAVYDGDDDTLRRPTPASASLSVRNVYFFDSFGEEEEEEEESGLPGRYTHMMHHVIRSANFTPAGFAQKSFFWTGLAQAVSNHFALRAVRPDVRLMVGLDRSLVRLHHYRKGCPPLMQKECDENYSRFRERDTLLWKYRDRLLENVVRRVRELGLEPGL